jgi:hypothetical protein
LIVTVDTTGRADTATPDEGAGVGMLVVADLDEVHACGCRRGGHGSGVGEVLQVEGGLDRDEPCG